MLPRAILISPVPTDALLEAGAIVIVGILVCLWAWTRAKERARTQAALAELESAHKILQRYVQLSRSEEKRLNVLHAISTILCGSLELKGLLRKATSMVSELMEVEVTLMFSVDEEAQELTLVGYEGISDESAQALDGIKIGEGIYGKVVETGQPIVVEDVSNDFRLTSPEFKKMQIQIQLIVPLAVRERITGAVCVAMRRPRQFTSDDMDLLTAAGSQIATAIENARLYEKERLVAQKLAVSERNYRRLFENASDAIWVHDLTGNIIAANKATEELTGYSIEELTETNRRVSDFLSDESLVLAGQIRRKVFQKEPVQQPYEQHLIRKDGTEAILMLTTSLITEDGRPSGFQHMARDVSRERWMQDNLRHYLQQITRAQEEERERIARDLHDDTAQALYAVTREVDNFIRSNGDMPADNAAFLRDLGEQIRRVLQGVRRFSQDLRPPMLDDLGLLATLRWLTDELNERCGIEADLRVLGTERRLEPHIELMLFRIVQEAFRNIERHAEASKVEAEMDFGEGKIRVSISDNGKGFELSGDLGDLPRTGKLGLAGMEERVRLVGGSLRIQTEPDKGTTVMIEVPK
jgi:PAS domain S-box-containing protein